MHEADRRHTFTRVLTLCQINACESKQEKAQKG